MNITDNPNGILREQIKNNGNKYRNSLIFSITFSKNHEKNTGALSWIE